MSWRYLLPFVGVAILAAWTPATAQERAVCFDPGTIRLTSEGYATLARAAEGILSPSGERRRLVIRGLRHERESLADARAEEVKLELMRLGVVEWKIGSLSGDNPSDCVDLSESGGSAPGPVSHPVLYFEAGSDEISHWSRRWLRFVSAQYMAGGKQVCVEAHADTSASRAESLALSRRRAERTAEELLRQGVRWDDIRIAALGETRLARPTPDHTPEPLNERVVIDMRRTCPASFG